MEPLLLELHNFMSHADTKVDLEHIDAACIQGPNGVGKSALADGILYALYGETSRGKDDKVVRLGQTVMHVVYDFAQSGEVYRIVRKKTTTGRGKNTVDSINGRAPTVRQHGANPLQWEPTPRTGSSSSWDGTSRR